MLKRHLSRCFLAGLVALLPVGGLVLSVALLEDAIAGSWMAEQAWYFPGLGLVAVALVVYAIGLVITSFLGRWVWGRVDALLDALPAVGSLYQTLKQILGYGEGPEALFQEVVLVPGRDGGAEEMGLVTRRLSRGGGAMDLLSVFVPGSPNPTQGRLALLPEDRVRPAGVSVSDAFSCLLAVGVTDHDVGGAGPVPGDGGGASEGA